MKAKADEAESTLDSGSSFGPYRIVRRLGLGGMAETFEATWIGPGGLNQRVCLKCVLPSLCGERQFVRLFEREVRLAAQLRHPGIVGILDHGEVDRTPYMALELIKGVDLLNLLLAQGRLSFEHVARSAIDLATALDYAHNLPVPARLNESETSIRGVVHRDLSPSNIMVSEEGRAMLVDFGLAKALSASSHYEGLSTINLPDGRVKGKVPYMSPEQLRNEALDGRADLFSLGVVLFEALTGSRPFDGGNDPTTMVRILRGEHIPLAELALRAPSAFCDVIDDLIRPDREQRPQSAAELIERLEGFAKRGEERAELGAYVAQLRHGGDTCVNRDDVQSGVGLKAGRRSVPLDAPSAPKGLRVSTRWVAITVAIVLVTAMWLVVRSI